MSVLIEDLENYGRRICRSLARDGHVINRTKRHLYDFIHNREDLLDAQIEFAHEFVIAPAPGVTIRYFDKTVIIDFHEETPLLAWRGKRESCPDIEVVCTSLLVAIALGETHNTDAEPGLLPTRHMHPDLLTALFTARPNHG